MRGGVLLCLALFGCADGAAEQPADVVWLSSSAQSTVVRDGCPPTTTSCVEVDLEDFDCPAHAGAHPVATLVISGHSTPPITLSGPSSRVADVARCYEPELIVLNTCYGFNDDLLVALAGAAPGAVAVGTLTRLPPEGLIIEPKALKRGDALARSAAIRTRSGAPITIWRLDSDALRRTRQDVQTWSRERLSQQLTRKHPNLVRAALTGGAEVLVEVPPWRFRAP